MSSQNGECCVCLEQAYELNVMPCLHTICNRCVIDMQDHQTTACVVCTEPFELAGLVPFNTTNSLSHQTSLGTTGKLLKQGKFCTFHGNNAKSAKFCESCQDIVCVHCANCVSQSHRLVSIEFALQKQVVPTKASIDTLQSQLSTLSLAINQLVDLLGILNRRRESLRYEITVAFDGLVALRPSRMRRLTTRREVLLMTAHSELTADIKTTELQRQVLQGLHEMLSTALRQSETLFRLLKANAKQISRKLTNNHSESIDSSSSTPTTTVATEQDLDQQRQEKQDDNDENTNSKAALTGHVLLLHLLHLRLLVGARVQTLTTQEPPLQPLVADTVRFSLCSDPWRVPIEKLGYVGRGRDYTLIDKPTLVFGSKGSGEGQFRDPYSVAVIRDDLIAVADKSNNRIQIISLEGHGSHVRSLPLSTAPYSVAVTPIGELWVCEYERSIISLISAEDGIVRTSIACPHPWCVAVKSTGEIFVSSNDNEVRAFSPDGNELWSSLGNGFAMCFGLAIIDNNKLIVCDAQQRMLQVLSCEDGAYLGTIANGLLRNPIGVAVMADGSLGVAEHSAHHVSVWQLGRKNNESSSEHVHVHNIGSFGDTLGLFKFPRDVAVLANGHIVVVDQGNHRIQVF